VRDQISAEDLIGEVFLDVWRRRRVSRRVREFAPASGERTLRGGGAASGLVIRQQTSHTRAAATRCSGSHLKFSREVHCTKKCCTQSTAFRDRALGATKDTITTEPTKRLAVVSSNVRGGFFRTLDRRAAMRAATRRHSGKGRAVPERCPSISVLLRSTRFTGVRSRPVQRDRDIASRAAGKATGRSRRRARIQRDGIRGNAPFAPKPGDGPPRTPACRTTSSNAPCPPCRTPVAMGVKAFLNSARSVQGEVLPVPSQDGLPFTCSA
jgi:hypothetical protein